MNREIKFRAWNIGTKTMIDLKKITPLALNMDTDGLFLPFSDGLPLMQFTGLKDRNGKEIYEGDLITDGSYADMPAMKFIGEIGFKDGSFIIVKSNCDCGECLNDRISRYEDIEVIGTVYQNPELLK